MNSPDSPRRGLQSTDALSCFESFDLTPSLGREFPSANLVEWMTSEDADVLLRDLAITVSRRGVVVFRRQDLLTNDLQKTLVYKLGQLTGNPSTSGLHIHPLAGSQSKPNEPTQDKEISILSSEQRTDLGKTVDDQDAVNEFNGGTWHSDIAYEPVPAAYTSLRLTELPSVGGDTVWASGYDVYDLISPPYRRFLERLTATFGAEYMKQIAEKSGLRINERPRGAPENVGNLLRAVHPVVRTNPVSGWKSIYPIGPAVEKINDVSRRESEQLLEMFKALVTQHHEIQVRLRWQNVNDIAIWDNRSVYHAATFDYDGIGERKGYRAVVVGEQPFLDPNSLSRREDLRNLGKIF